MHSLASSRLVLFLTAAFCLLVYLLRLDRSVGLYVDDAWYVLLGKAIAEGKGFTLINAPVPGIMPFYPPGFPALLSLPFRVWPDFPANVVALKLVSIAAMLASGALVFHFFVRERRVTALMALGLAVATVLSPAFGFLATSTVMSEPVFLLAQLATIVAIERAAHVAGERCAVLFSLLAAGLGAFAFLVRSMALGLLVSSVLYLLLRKRRAPAIAFAFAVGALVGPWMLHARANAPTPQQQATLNDAITHPYSTHFWHKVAGKPPFGIAKVTDLPARVWRNAKYLAGSDIGAMSVYPYFRSIESTEWMIEGGGREAISYTLALITLLGFLRVVRSRLSCAELVVASTIGIALLWPFAPTRFILPLLPFLLFYLAVGLAWIAGLLGSRRTSGRPQQGDAIGRGSMVAIASVWVVAVIGLLGNAHAIAQVQGLTGEPSRWVQQFEDRREVLDWMKGALPPDTIVASQNPAFVHLFTGRPTVGSWDPKYDLEQWRRTGARVCFDCWMDDSFGFKTIHRSPSGKIAVVDLRR